MSNTAIQNEGPATPAEIWAILRETARRTEEVARRTEEVAKLHAEAAEESKRRQAEWEAQRQADAEESKQMSKVFDLKMDKLRESIREMGQNIGGLNNSFGSVVEHLVMPGIFDKFKELGFELYDYDQNQKPKDKEGRIIAEVDAMLSGEEVAVVVSIKAKATEKDIEEHQQQMTLLSEHGRRDGDKRRYYGAVASAVMNKSLRSQILKAGFYPVEQSGDTMRIAVPKRFKPRQW